MKRLLIGLIVFSLTFVGGVGTIWTFGRATFTAPDDANQFPPSKITTKPSAAVVSPELGSAGDEHVEDSQDAQLEHFMDERRIGHRGKNKIEIRCFNRGRKRLAEITFYSRSEFGAWFERQSFRFEKDDLLGCDPVVEDFNNDGLRDFTYRSAVAARGANEVRRLFIYDKEKDELVHINNSQEYPNLAYNKKLNCIDSFMIHGASSTVFLRIEGDTLKEFASVGTGLERVVTVTDQFGEERVISREKMNPDNYEEIYRRFSTYSPPR